METQMFAVIPSLGPLVPGHTLLCSKEHLKNFARIILKYDIEYNQVKSELIKILGRLYNQPVHCFEHGSASSSSRVLCTVDHAHLHFVPTSVGITDIIMTEGIWQEIDGSLSSLHDLVGSNEYLYYESPDNNRLVRVEKSGIIPSQYMRKVFATALGNKAKWNWREDPRLIETIQTFDMVSSACI